MIQHSVILLYGLDVIHCPECGHLILDGQHLRFEVPSHTRDVHIQARVQRFLEALPQIHSIYSKQVNLVTVEICI